MIFGLKISALLLRSVVPTKLVQLASIHQAVNCERSMKTARLVLILPQNVCALFDLHGRFSCRAIDRPIRNHIEDAAPIKPLRNANLTCARQRPPQREMQPTSCSVLVDAPEPNLWPKFGRQILLVLSSICSTGFVILLVSKCRMEVCG